MAFAPPVKAKVSSNLAKSTWTPMNHPEANLQVFEERREIIQKWFQKWQDTQKRIIVNDILKNLSNKHMVSLHETLNAKFPEERHDFTRILPRVLTLYLFSFLDPRTLCRCAQVSWYWNYLSEMDCLWRPKCLKFGWYPTYQPSPFEEKVWKRFYVSTVHDLNFVKIKSVENKHEKDHDRLDTARSDLSRLSIARSTTSSFSGLKKGPTIPSTKKPLSAPKWQPPPWKGSDPHPVDTMRYNYLNNKSKSKKKSMSPGGRPSSKQGRRPQSAVGKSREHKEDDVSIASARRSSRDHLNGERLYDLPVNKTAQLSGSTLANYAGTGTVPSPRLNKDFKLPNHNGNDLHSSGHVGMPSASNSTLQRGSGYPTITNQINWNPEGTRNSFNTSHNYPEKQGGSSKILSEVELSRLSMDAGVRPQPVTKLSSDKMRRSRDMDVTPPVKDEEQDKIRPTTNTGDLRGKGWSAPTHSDSDDEF